MQENDQSEAFAFGPYRLIPSKRILLAGKNRVELRSRALDILTLLVRHRGEVVTRRQILERVWPDQVMDEANLRVQISELRRALKSEGSAFIKNVHGRGYVFVAPSQAEPETGASTTSQMGNLPAAQRPLIGRSNAIETLLTEIVARRFVTIVGPGGIGKTTLAAELGRHLANEFNDDIRYVDLGLLDAPDAVLPAIAAALGSRLHSDDLPALAASVAHRRLLLIVDCCEHVIDAAANVAAALFQHAPQIHLVATSREALRADGEAVYLLEPLGLPAEKEDLTASEALSAASVQLFMQHVTASGHAVELENHQAPVVAEICRRLDGNPLAIGLAGSWLTTYGFRGLVEGLRGRNVLRWWGRRHEPRHRTLEATLDWSFRLLSDVERRVLVRLSVLVGPFTMEIAQAVARDAVDDDWIVAQAIEELIDKSLIKIVPLGDAYGYRIMDVTRFYAQTKVTPGGESASIVRAAHQSVPETRSVARQTASQRDARLSPRYRATTLAAAGGNRNCATAILS